MVFYGHGDEGPRLPERVYHFRRGLLPLGSLQLLPIGVFL